MHTQARYFIRTALIFLVAAFFVGALVLVNQGLALDENQGAAADLLPPADGWLGHPDELRRGTVDVPGVLA